MIALELTMSVDKELRKVAIFDIDGTIFRSSLLVEVTEAMIRRGMFPEKARQRYADAYKLWLDREGSYEDYIMAVVRAFAEHIPGIGLEDFQGIGREVVQANKGRVYRYTRDLLKELKAQGYFLLAISLSPKTVVHEFAIELGFDKVYGLLYKWEEDRYGEGLESTEILEDKGRTLMRAVEKEGLTLESSVGVGDTEGDIKFLKLVSRPICFNPNRMLYDHARKAKWEVVVERKDVIYELPITNL